MAKRKRTKKDLQNISQKTKDRGNPTKNRGELMCFRRVSRCCSTCCACFRRSHCVLPTRKGISKL